MLAAQCGKCAGCGKPDPEHVDHDHATGKVRELLCFNCNQALGNVRDDLTVLGRLQDYLMRHLPVPDPRPPVEVRLREMLVEVTAGTLHTTGEA